MISTLIATKPVASSGNPIGDTGWNITFEMALPTYEDSLWDVAVWNTDIWSELAWTDLTPHVRGCQWTRGSDGPHGRPRVGEMTLTLDSNENRFSPWNTTNPFGGSPTYFGPGSLIRVALHSQTDTRADGWIPQFCGLVENWNPTFVGVDGDQYVNVSLIETLSFLAGIDDNALASPVGSGEFIAARIQRLLDASSWPFGFINRSGLSDSFFALQSTDMAMNRIAECYVSADSSTNEILTDRSGAALLNARLWTSTLSLLNEFATNPTNVIRFAADDFNEYDPESLVIGNNDDHIVNDARFTRIGGTQQVVEHPVSIGRFGRKTLLRTDLIGNSDFYTKYLAFYTADIRGSTTLQVENLTVHLRRSDESTLMCASADIGDWARIYPPGSTVTTGPRFHVAWIRAMTHNITPVPGDVHWTIDFAFDTMNILNIIGAQLPPIPPL